MMERWTVRNVKFNTIGFAKALGVSPVVAKLMVNRSIYELNEAKSFLNSTIHFSMFCCNSSLNCFLSIISFNTSL